MTSVKSLFLFLFFICLFPSFSQQIENVDFIVKDNIITVTYDLIGCTPQHLYDTKLSVTCNGKSIDPLSVSGDLNKVSCGKHKQISWNVLNDKTELKGSIQVSVNISKTYSTKITGGPANAFLSMLLPGVGDYFVNRPSKTWYVISVLYLSAASYAISNKIQSNASYKLYHQATTQAEMDANYKTANDKYQSFQLLIGAMGAIWVADVIYVTIKGFQNRKKQLNNMALNEPKVKFYFAGTTKTFQFGLVRKF